MYRKLKRRLLEFWKRLNNLAKKIIYVLLWTGVILLLGAIAIFLAMKVLKEEQANYPTKMILKTAQGQSYDLSEKGLSFYPFHATTIPVTGLDSEDNPASLDIVHNQGQNAKFDVRTRDDNYFVVSQGIVYSLSSGLQHLISQTKQGKLLQSATETTGLSTTAKIPTSTQSVPDNSRINSPVPAAANTTPIAANSALTAKAPITMSPNQALAMYKKNIGQPGNVNNPVIYGQSTASPNVNRSESVYQNTVSQNNQTNITNQLTEAKEMFKSAGEQAVAVVNQISQNFHSAAQDNYKFDIIGGKSEPIKSVVVSQQGQEVAKFVWPWENHYYQSVNITPPASVQIFSSKNEAATKNYYLTGFSISDKELKPLGEPIAISTASGQILRNLQYVNGEIKIVY